MTPKRPVSNSDLLRSLVLIADNDRLVRVQLRQSLEQEGYRVIEATNCAMGLDAFQQEHPDLVLLDMLLPDQGGLECCKQIHLLSGGQYTPVLMMTGGDDEQSIDQAFALGVVDCVTKPVLWSILRHRLRRFLHQAQQSRRLEAENQQLTRLVTLDGLTRIPNRRRFDEHLDAMWRQMARDEDWLAVIIADVDFFKAYNDTYGHLAGDHCLQMIAEALSHCCYRPMDLVARYGGEEFSIILPQTNLAGALGLAERMQATIQALSLPHEGSPIRDRVTLSFGVAAVQPHVNLLPDILLETTDVALYKAKSLGRDQIVGMVVKTAD
jgi:diguanylate cyclase (GGDEF)-like protein